MAVLIYPPLTKACEPPAGICRIAAWLSARGDKCTIWDANLEGILYICGLPPIGEDTWTKGAYGRFSAGLQTIRNPNTRKSFDRYRRAVSDINRLVRKNLEGYNVQASLADYRDLSLSPTGSSDLLKAAENHTRNPFYPFYRERILSTPKINEADVFGISLSFLSQAVNAFALAGLLRTLFPGAQIIMGGGLITSWMKGPSPGLSFPGLIDALVPGAGEDNPAVLTNWKEPNSAVVNSEYAFPPSLTRETRTSESTPETGYYFDYTQTPLDSYLSPGRILPFAASRGCFYQGCSFCPERAENTPFSPLPADMAAEAISALSAMHRPDLIHILDNALSPALMKAMIRRPPQAPWYGFARISRILAEDDFVHSLKKSGCAMLKLGIESGDNHVLERMNKGTTVEKTAIVLKKLHSAGISVYAYMLFGTPYEDEASAERSFEYLAKYGEYMDFLNLAIFNMPLFGPEAKKFPGRTFSGDDLSLYKDFEHPSGWSRKKVRLFLDRKVKRHPLIARRINNVPPFFTSNHAAFFIPQKQPESSLTF